MIGASIVVAVGAAVIWLLVPGAETKAVAVLPAPVVAVAPAPARVEAAGPTFDVVRVGPQGDAVVAGRGAPGADIVVFDGAVEVARARTDARGEFVALPAAPLAAGGRELSLTSRVGAGAEVKGEETVVLAVPEAPRAVARREAPAETAPVVAMLVPRAGAPRVLQDAPKRESAPGVTLDTVEYDDAGAIRFKGGTAADGSTVRLYVDNGLIGEGRADAAGRWAVTPGGAVAPGVHVVRADRVGGDGAVVARVEMPFQRTEVSPTDVAGGRVVVQPGQNLWRLARAAYGRGVQYTVIYLANREQIRDVRRIYPGQAFSVPR